MNENYMNEYDTMHALKEMIETELKDILRIGIQEDNIDNLGKLIDIHKDLENEEYWDYKKSKHSYSQDKKMNLADKKSGMHKNLEEKVCEMMEHCEHYSEATKAVSKGDYEAKEISMKSLKYMLESACQFIDMLAREANSQEEMQLIRMYTRKIGRMF